MKSPYITNNNQQGMVSFIVTLVLMIVITLIVIGFAQISRREQRQALDRQLSTQAFYAAESAINDASKAISSGAYTIDKTSCTDTPADAPSFTAASSVLDATNKIAYTCLLIDQSPNTLTYPVSNYTAVSADMSFKDPSTGLPTTASQITITWNDTGGGAIANSSGGGYPKLPPESGSGSNWNGSALLRVAITNLSGVLPYTRTNLENNTFTVFLYPNGGPSGTATFSNVLANQGQIIGSTCSAVSCSANISIPNLGHVFLRVGAIYKNTVVTITANNAGVTDNIAGAQAVIDATGKAQDVLRRIQVHLPLQPQSDNPVFAVQAVKGICKQLVIDPVSLITSNIGAPVCP